MAQSRKGLRFFCGFRPRPSGGSAFGWAVAVGRRGCDTVGIRRCRRERSRRRGELFGAGLVGQFLPPLLFLFAFLRQISLTFLELIIGFCHEVTFDSGTRRKERYNGYESRRIYIAGRGIFAPSSRPRFRAAAGRRGYGTRCRPALLVERPEVAIASSPEIQGAADRSSQYVSDLRCSDGVFERDGLGKRLPRQAVPPSTASYDHCGLRGESPASSPALRSRYGL